MSDEKTVVGIGANAAHLATKKSIKDMAREELEKELVGELKDKLKKKMKDVYLAKQVVDNLNREIEDLELEIGHKLKGI